MPSLLDIADPEFSSTEIDVGGRSLTIRGVKAKEWLVLYARFPELREMVEGREVEVSRPRMIELQCAVIAAGTGHAGDAQHERAARNKLTRDELTKAVQEIISLSYPGHVYGPLLDAEEGSDAAPASAKRATK